MSRSTYMGMFIGCVLSASVWMLFTAEASDTLLPDPTTTTSTTVAPTTTAVVVTTTSTTTTTTTTTTTLPAAVTDVTFHCPDAMAQAYRVGWPVEQLVHLDAIVWRESRCRPDAYSATHDHGLTQINQFWCAGSSAWLKQQGVIDDCADLFRPRVNLRAALAIWHRSGWQPWGG